MRALKKISAILTLSILVVTGALGQSENAEPSTTTLKEVVVTGTRFELPVEKSGKTIYKIDEETLRKNAGKSVGDILNEIPSIQIDGNFSAPGTNMSYFSRGGRNKNTLILIDGIPLNDPSGIDAFYDLRLLPLNQVASIEVLHGGLSTLYGTNASASVINITLKEAGDDTFGGSVDVSAGSFGTYNGGINVNGKTDRLSYLVTGNLLTSDGLSAASDENSNTDFANDAFKQQNTMAKLGYQVSESFNVDLVAAYDEFEADYDNGQFADGDNEQLNDQFRVGITPKYSYDQGSISLKTIYNVNNREFRSSFPSQNKGRNLQADLVQEHKISDNIKGLWGINLQRFSYKQEGVSEFSDNKFTILDPYASLFFENNTGLNVHVGIRLNTHSEYGNKFIYNLNPSYLIDLNDEVKIKVIASLSTAYITPSLFQLYSSFGNTNLKPEESLNYEGGFSLYLNSTLTFNTVYFVRDEKDPIGFDFTLGTMGAYNNLTTDRTVKGIETSLQWKINEVFSASANYSYAEADEESTFYRIPNTKIGLTLNAQTQSGTSISAKFLHTGARQTQDFATFPANIVDLDSYNVVDLYVGQNVLNDRLRVFGAINNALDADFVGIYGFTTRGRNFNIGVSYQL